MSWEYFKFKELAIFSQGIQVDIDQQVTLPSIGYVRFIRIVDFTKGSLDDLRYIKHPGDRYLVNEDDLVMIRYGSQTAGKIARGFSGAIANNTFKITVDESRLDKTFTFYYLAQDSIYEYFHNSQSSSTMPAITFSMIGELDFPFPPLPEQKAIASVLSSLDDKIDLLHRQNKTLEAMAETLFRQWFIEEAKEDWEECELSEFGHIICGKTPSKSNANYFGNDVPFLKIPDMHGRVFISKTTDNLSQLGALSQSKKMVPQNSICVSCIATVGLVCITDCDLQTNQQINSIVPNELKFLYYLYEVMLDMYDELHNLASGGTATLNLNTGDFSRIKIVKPDDVTLLQFNNAVIPLFTKIRFNGSQIQTLEQLRDMLLPKLMSGEVRVQYQTEEVA